MNDINLTPAPSIKYPPNYVISYEYLPTSIDYHLLPKLPISGEFWHPPYFLALLQLETGE